MADCPVCLGNLQSPVRVLPCCHSFCQDCLRQLRNKCGVYNVYDGTISVKCPKCRRESRLVKGKVSTLPTNFALNHLLQLQFNAVANPILHDDEISQCNQQSAISTNNQRDEGSSTFYSRIRSASFVDEEMSRSFYWQGHRTVTTMPFLLSLPRRVDDTLYLIQSVMEPTNAEMSSVSHVATDNCLVPSTFDDLELSLCSNVWTDEVWPVKKECFQSVCTGTGFSYRLCGEKYNPHDFNAYEEESERVTDIVTTSETDECSRLCYFVNCNECENECRKGISLAIGYDSSTVTTLESVPNEVTDWNPHQGNHKRQSNFNENY